MKVRLKTLPDEPRGGAWRSSVRGVNCPVKSGKQLSDAMKAKLSKEFCYLAGLSRLSKEEKSKVSAKSEIKEIIERFVEIAVKLGVEPRKIVVEENETFFYHSKIARQIRKIRENEIKVFRHRNELSSSYIAGIFDARGSIRSKSVEISSMKPSEAIMLENLGMHVRGNRIANISEFIMLIKGYSLRIELIQLPGNERDPR